jgi:hypothetical protein
VADRFLSLPAAEVNGRPASMFVEQRSAEVSAHVYECDPEAFDVDREHDAETLRDGNEPPWKWAVVDTAPVVRVEDSPTASPAPLTDAEIAALREAVAKMTPWPWIFSTERQEVDATQLGTDGEVYDRYSLGPVDIDEMWCEDDAATWATDAAGIVALRNAADRLLSTVAALRAEVRDLTSRTERQSIASDKLAAGLGDEMATVAALTADLATARAVAGGAQRHLTGLIDAAGDLRDGWAEGGCLVTPPCRACRWCIFERTVDAVRADLTAGPGKEG